MKIQDVQRKERKEVTMSIRINKEDSKWMKDKKVSPSKIFHEALKELREG